MVGKKPCWWRRFGKMGLRKGWKEGLREKMKPSILTCNPSLIYVWEDKKRKKWKRRRVALYWMRREKNGGRWWMGCLMGVEFGPLHASPCYLDKSWKGAFGLIGLDLSWVGSNWFGPKHRTWCRENAWWNAHEDKLILETHTLIKLLKSHNYI